MSDTFNLEFKIPARITEIAIGMVADVNAVKLKRDDGSEEVRLLDGSYVSESEVFKEAESLDSAGFQKFGLLSVKRSEDDTPFYLAYLAKDDVDMSSWIEALPRNDGGQYLVQSTDGVKVFHGFNHKGFSYDNGSYYACRVCETLKPVVSGFLDEKTLRIPTNAVFSVTTLDPTYKSGLFYGEYDYDNDSYTIHYIPAEVVNVVPGDGEDVWMRNPALKGCLKTLTEIVKANGLHGKVTVQSVELLRANNEPSPDIPRPSIAAIAALKVLMDRKETFTVNGVMNDNVFHDVTSLANPVFADYIRSISLDATLAEEVEIPSGFYLFFKRRDGGMKYVVTQTSHNSALQKFDNL